MSLANAPSSVFRESDQQCNLSSEDLEFQDDVFRIKVDGFTILRGVWSAAQCAAARERLDQLRDDELVSQGKTAGSEVGFATGHLYNKGEVFEGVYQATRVLRLVRHFLGDDATIMSLGDNGITGEPRVVHRGTYQYCCNGMWQYYRYDYGAPTFSSTALGRRIGIA